MIIPWTSWLQTGDTTIIEENWAAMTKYLDAIEAHNPDGLWKNESGIPFGDWLSPEGKTDQTLIATAYWAYDVTLMRQMAHATGRAQDEEKYARLFEKIRAAFEKQFVHADGFVAGADNSPSQFGAINNPNAKSTGGDTQTGYVLALHMNLVPDDLRAAAAKRLADKIAANHDLLGTGFLGTPYLLEELTKEGYTKLAYTLLLNTSYPSWGYMVTHGATTMWERWNGDQMFGDPSMNSYEPLRLWRSGRLDLSLRGRHRCHAARCGLPHSGAASGFRCTAGQHRVRLRIGLRHDSFRLDD